MICALSLLGGCARRGRGYDEGEICVVAFAGCRAPDVRAPDVASSHK